MKTIIKNNKKKDKILEKTDRVILKSSKKSKSKRKSN